MFLVVVDMVGASHARNLAGMLVSMCLSPDLQVDNLLSWHDTTITTNHLVKGRLLCRLFVALLKAAFRHRPGSLNGGLRLPFGFLLGQEGFLRPDLTARF